MLASLEIPEGIVSIGTHALRYTVRGQMRHGALSSQLATRQPLLTLPLPQTNLREVKLPRSLRHIGPRAFSRSGVRHVSLPVGLESVGDFAFCECKDLKYISVPKLCDFGSKVFTKCSSLVASDVDTSDTAAVLRHLKVRRSQCSRFRTEISNTHRSRAFSLHAPHCSTKATIT